MSEPTADRKLLLAYHRDGSHEAFGQLVGKYSPMVFQTALRRTRDHQLAEDVTQAVFIVLARRAGSLRSHESIAGWLHQTAIFASSSALRAQARQRKHESAAAKSEAILYEAPDESSEQTARVEEEVHRLPTIHRNVLVLCYLEGKTIPQMAEVLGVSHETARKRLSRALDRLRVRLVRRGVTVSATSVVSTVAAIAGTASNAQASAIAPLSVAGGQAGSAFTLASDLLHVIRLLALKKTAAVLMVVGLCGGIISITAAQLVPEPAAPTPTTIPTTTASADQALWRPVLERFDRSRQSIHTLSARFAATFQSKITSSTGWIFWALDGDKQAIDEGTSLSQVTGSPYRHRLLQTERETLDGEVSLNPGPGRMSQFWIYPTPRAPRVLHLSMFFGTTDRTALMDFFDSAIARGGRASYEEATEAGHRVARLGLVGSAMMVFIFDRDRNALLRIEQWNKGATAIEYTQTADELQQFGPELWLPVKHTLHLREDEQRTFTTADLTVNQPVDPALFHVSLPQNSAIQDYRTRTLIQIDEPVELVDFSVEQINSLESVAGTFKPLGPAGTTKPARPDSRSAAHYPQPATIAMRQVSSAAGWISVAAIAGGTMLLALATALGWRLSASSRAASRR